jgi:hypothetical protein
VKSEKCNQQDMHSFNCSITIGSSLPLAGHGTLAAVQNVRCHEAAMDLFLRKEDMVLEHTGYESLYSKPLDSPNQRLGLIL